LISRAARADNFVVLSEVFECPRCERQFIVDETPEGSATVHCPQCGRYLGERDLSYVLRSEIDELVERLEFERNRLENDAAVYGMTECEAEMKLYGREIPAAIGVLRETIGKLRKMSDSYRPAETKIRRD
jgi:transcription elongation factor Elf1